jgi:hypothetical protein
LSACVGDIIVGEGVGRGRNEAGLDDIAGGEGSAHEATDGFTWRDVQCESLDNAAIEGEVDGDTARREVVVEDFDVEFGEAEGVGFADAHGGDADVGEGGVEGGEVDGAAGGGGLLGFAEAGGVVGEEEDGGAGGVLAEGVGEAEGLCESLALAGGGLGLDKLKELLVIAHKAGGDTGLGSGGDEDEFVVFVEGFGEGAQGGEGGIKAGLGVGGGGAGVHARWSIEDDDVSARLAVRTGGTSKSEYKSDKGERAEDEGDEVLGEGEAAAARLLNCKRFKEDKAGDALLDDAAAVEERDDEGE